MRSTLTLDKRVSAIAKARARQRGITTGQAVSELALAGLEHEKIEGTNGANGLVMLPSVKGHIITNEMVAEALADE
ncbi:MAG: hypothetical protein Q4G30_01055 [Actinomycetaceae bacterium]|nr:hypothetical protein [Actinomycetaceae bacterium]